MKVKYYLLRPDSKTETGLICSISFKSDRLRLGIDESIKPKYWNVKTNSARTTPSFPEAPEFNKRLADITSGIKKVYYESFEDGLPPTKQQLKASILKNVLKKGKRFSLFEFYQDFIDKTVNGRRFTASGKVIAPATAKHYKTALKTLREFNPTLSYNDITLEFYNEYIKYLNKKGLSLNTVGDHIKRLKSVMAAALEAGHHRNDKFKGKSFIKPSEEADNIFLSIDELKEIEKLDLSNIPYLDRVRDLFLVGCFTGLRFSDFSRLTAEHITDGFITIKQVKTSEDVTIPVHSIVKKIIKKYNGDLPRAISNQKFNFYLKEVCKKVKCLQETESKTTTKAGSKITVNMQKWEMVSSHTARRSFATNEYLNGTSTLTIMAVTGHKTEKAFLKYIKVSKKEEAVRMQQQWTKRERKLKAV